MNSREIQILIRLLLGALTSFWAIYFWSKERDSAWTLIVLGVLVYYINILIHSLNEFKIIDLSSYSINGFPIISIIIESIPFLLFSAGFIIGIIKRSRV